MSAMVIYEGQTSGGGKYSVTAHTVRPADSNYPAAHITAAAVEMGGVEKPDRYLIDPPTQAPAGLVCSLSVLI